MKISEIIEDILQQNADLIEDYCRSHKDCDNDTIPNMAIYGKFLAKLPYNDVNFIKLCLEHFTLRLKVECRKIKIKKIINKK